MARKDSPEWQERLVRVPNPRPGEGGDIRSKLSAELAAADGDDRIGLPWVGLFSASDGGFILLEILLLSNTVYTSDTRPKLELIALGRGYGSRLGITV